jgi:hypothetical protein
MLRQTQSLRCPLCGQAATLTLNDTPEAEAHRTGATKLIELTCSNAKRHDQLPHSELLNLWAALTG